MSGPGVLAFTAAYLAALVLIALFASRRERRRRGTDVLEEHDLGGRDLSLWVLLGTLYATQYSGNSFVGFTGKAARDGYRFLGSVIFMQAIVVAYLLFAPQLYALSRRRRYRTPGDFIRDRYACVPLHILANLLMLFALLNFVLSQLVAIGNITQVMGLEAGGISLHPAWGIFSLAVLMVVYETIGGMRAVAWTDLLQGGLLFLGATGLFWVLQADLGGMGAVLERYAAHWPENVKAPSGGKLMSWIGGILMLGIGASVYPHAIQRIYAARSERVLRRSLALMVFLPLLTTLPLFLVGISARMVAGDQALSGDQAMPFILKYLTTLPGGALLALLVLAGAVSAMMSTADSALLTISSIVNRDLMERYLARRRSTRFYLRAGVLSSWLVILALAAFATWIVAQKVTIWQILSIKLELLMQIAPAIWIGVRTRRLRGKAAFAGMLAGAVFTLSMWLLHRQVVSGAFAFWVPAGADPAHWPSCRKILGLQAGVWGLGLNLAVCLGALCFWPQREKASPAEPE